MELNQTILGLKYVKSDTQKIFPYVIKSDYFRIEINPGAKMKKWNKPIKSDYFRIEIKEFPHLCSFPRELNQTILGLK